MFYFARCINIIFNSLLAQLVKYVIQLAKYNSYTHVSKHDHTTVENVHLITRNQQLRSLTQLSSCSALAASLDSSNANLLNCATKSPEHDVLKCSKMSSSLLVRADT